jgi:hypothetical protein
LLTLIVFLLIKQSFIVNEKLRIRFFVFVAKKQKQPADWLEGTELAVTKPAGVTDNRGTERYNLGV